MESDIAGPDVLALPSSHVDARDAEDMPSIVAIAGQLLSGRSSRQVDLRQTYRMRDVAISLDNCSHRSGKQRAYVSCPRARNCPTPHYGCYRYITIDEHRSVGNCVARLALWAEECNGKPDTWSKADHLGFQPSEAAVAAAVAAVELIS